MKVSSLLALLGNFDSAVAFAAGSRNANLFTKFGELFLGYEGENLLPFINKLIKQRDLQGRGKNTQPIASLREALIKLETCLRSAEANKPAEEIARLVELLEGCGQSSVDAFVNEARGWLEPKPKRPKPAPPPRLSPADYADLLRQTSDKNAEFDQTVERLRKDRKIKTEDMFEVARLFLGYVPKKKGRADALTAITDRQTVEARQNARGSLIGGLKPWRG